MTHEIHRVRVALLLLLFPLALAAGGCRSPKPLVEPSEIAAAGSRAQTRGAILAALDQNKFTVVSEQPGQIIARTGARKWNMIVAIDYANDVSIRYVNSENLDYHLYTGDNAFVSRGTPVIHPGYNKRVERLASAIGTQTAIARAEKRLPPVGAPPPSKSKTR